MSARNSEDRRQEIRRQEVRFSRRAAPFVALALVGATVVLRLALGFRQGDAPVGVMFVFPIVLAAHLAGMAGGLCAVALVALGTKLLFFAPMGSLAFATPTVFLHWFLLCAVGVVVTVLVGIVQRSRSRAVEDRDRLAAALAEERRAEQGLKESEARYQRFFESIDEGATINELLRDARGEIVDLRVVEMNPPGLAEMGKRLDQVRGRTWSELYGSDAAGYVEIARAVMASAERRRAFDTYMETIGRHYRARAFALDDHLYVTTGVDVTAQVLAERALEDSRARFRALIERSSELIMVLDAEERFTFWSPSATELLGWTADEVLGRLAYDEVHPDDREHTRAALAALLARPGDTGRLVLRQRHRDGSWRLLDALTHNLLHDPAVRGVVVNARDVTEQQRLEEQYQQAQRLESVGRLAGGVAHDFNNLLTVVLSCASALKEDHAAGRPILAEDLDEIRGAGERARNLTRQLLAFARRQVVTPVPLDLSAVVRSGEKLLRRLMGEDVLISLRLGEGPAPVVADPVQLEQVLFNLAVNARDAMPGGGSLALETGQLHAGPAEEGRPAHPPGDWVWLQVKDSGTGMSPEVKAHAFEPFYTTKGPGKGTGLGLATVHGIVMQAGGHLHLESEPGRGAEFRICFPRTPERPGPATPAPAPPPGPLVGTETVLVVEDDPNVRNVTVRILERAGYRVLVASDGDQALELAGAETLPVGLLLTDVVMPGLSGPEVAKALRRRWPRLRVLYVSGYSPDLVAERGPAGAGLDLLPKPFTPAALLARVRATLDVKA